MNTAPFPSPRGPYAVCARESRLAQVLRFGRDRARGRCEGNIAEPLGVARTTLRSALAEHVARVRTESDAYWESPEGQALLRRLVTILHVVLTLCNPCGVEQVCQVLRLSGLDRWVAASYGVHQRYNTQLVAAVKEYAKEQTQTLGTSMPLRRITIALDEVFFGHLPWLVALEAASGWLLVETQEKKRDEATWTAAMAHSLAGLNVEVVQGVGDEGAALGACIEISLGAHRSTDLFHGQYEMTRACSAALRAKQTQAEKDVEKAEAALRKATVEKPLVRPLPAYVYDPAEGFYQARSEAIGRVVEAQARRTQLREAVKNISTAYHPFDLATGAARDAEEVERDLRQAHASAQQLAQAAGLAFTVQEKLAKAERLVARMAATVTFFHQTATRWVLDAVASLELQTLVLHVLVPYFYLQKVAHRLSCKDARTTVLATIARLESTLLDPTGSWASLAASDRERLQQVALTCADLFVRTSSPVEGRNGRLSLHHHAYKTLRPDKLAALTAVHNFLIQRHDGTTAAERFFGQKPPDLLAHLVSALPLPGRPAASRSRPHRKDLKMAA